MMEKPPAQHNGFKNTLEDLAQALTSEEVSPDDFLDKVLELDQSDPERKSSLVASEILSRPEIVEMFEGIEECTKFYSIRSLTFFHKAQIRLSNGDMDVKGDLHNALNDSIKVGHQDEDWANYIRATIAYLDSDLDSLREFSRNLHLNRSLVQNFVNGLLERGHPNYLEDYAKERESDEE